jgi:uncharacterized membrane protein
MQTRDVEAGHGWQWIKQGFALFRKSPLLWWVLLGIIFIAYLLLHGVLGNIGDILFALIYPTFAAGIMIGCRALDQGQELELAHLFAGFRGNLRSLLMIGVVSIAAGVAISLLITWVLPVDETVIKLLNDPATDPMRWVQWTLILTGSQLLLSVPLLMAVWFAPALLAFQPMSARHAIRWSFYACLSNIGAFLVYGLASVALTVLAAIPIGLGLILLIPTMVASTYSMYRDIFVEDAAAGA